jgi:hypothetical protein
VLYTLVVNRYCAIYCYFVATDAYSRRFSIWLYSRKGSYRAKRTQPDGFIDANGGDAGLRSRKASEQKFELLTDAQRLFEVFVDRPHLLRETGARRSTAVIDFATEANLASLQARFLTHAPGDCYF